MDTPDPQPSTPESAKTPSLALVVAGIVLAFVAVAVVAGLIAQQSTRESARLVADVDALRKEMESLQRQVKTLAADTDRTAVLSLTQPAYFPVRTNGGTLLMAVAHVDDVENGLRVHLTVGNPHSMTYLGFTLAFGWDKGKGTQTFSERLAPGTWTVVPLILAPADRTSTQSLTITSALVDEIPVR
jgi:hypothetical protein